MVTMRTYLIFITSIIMIQIFSSSAIASVMYPFPDETKVKIFSTEGIKIEKGTLRLTNPGEQVWLVQSWVEDNERKRTSAVYPSISRLEPKGKLVLNIYPLHEDINKDGWVVVLFIPPKDSTLTNQVIIPVAYRLKMEKNNNKV